MAARFAEVTDTGRRWRARTAPAPTPVELACAGGGPAIDAVLVDVSTFGCRMRSDGAGSVGDHVRVAFAGRPPVAATVVWREASAIGCRFDKPIPTALMRSLLCGER